MFPCSVLMLRFRSELGLDTRVGTAMATRVMDMGIIDRIHTTATPTMGGLHSTGQAGIESITATVVITTAIGTKCNVRKIRVDSDNKR